MSKLQISDELPELLFETPYETNLSFRECISHGTKTAILFLRYFGCPICQLDLHNLSKHYKEITASGGQVFVVLQSRPDLLKDKIGEDKLPYVIICDPEQLLYEQFEVGAAGSMKELGDSKTMLKIAKATAKGYKHGEYEGNELQLPALFIVNQASTLTYVHYGKSAGDIPDVKELKKLLEQ